jgi:hypothetical protein
MEKKMTRGCRRERCRSFEGWVLARMWMRGHVTLVYAALLAADAAIIVGERGGRGCHIKIFCTYISM